MNCLQWLANMHSACCFMSVEKPAMQATKSELRRWFASKSVEINFQSVAADDELPLAIKSAVLFPKSAKRRCTLVFDNSFTLIQIT